MRESIELGNLIRSMRQAAGMSQMALAERLDLSYQQVQKYENGKSSLSVSRLYQVADTLGLSIASFLEDTPKGKGPVWSKDELNLIIYYRSLPEDVRKAANRFLRQVRVTERDSVVRVEVKKRKKRG